MPQFPDDPGAALLQHGIRNPARVLWNLSAPALYAEILQRHEAQVAQGGALVVRTGQHTGRSPNDKFIVREPSSQEHIWWGAVNRPFDAKRFDSLHQRVLAYLEGKELFVQDCAVGADPAYRRPIRVITETAWHSLFAGTLFRSAERDQRPEPAPSGFTVLHAPHFQAEPERDGTNSPTFILVHFGKRLILIGGTSYAGEIKKSVFTIMNYLLPLERVLSMHCAANVGPAGDVALFFGLSGTGKTSLSADSCRTLIGDDEHGWSDQGVFNFENGCYAKMIRLSPTAEPEIYATSRRFGTILENVAMDPVTRELDLHDESLTENTRGAYPLGFIPNASTAGTAGHPSNVLMLTCDAFGVMPPIAKLAPEEAMYHFVSGYTAKVAGTERGVKEPQATFSACFGAPFMALHPCVYAKLLGEKIARHRVQCWLVNTGWTGGPYGIGSRIRIGYTRAMVEAALSGALRDAPTEPDPLFRFAAVRKCPGVPDEFLNPRAAWANPRAYDAKAQELAAKFRENFVQFADCEPLAVCEARPSLWKPGSDPVG
ncbi:MAG: phosphoenolpyruvate carboxykinase (ATP) [Candidatus Omnitrophica bacterium]|nr:phosphoenolpyruvate carboxykinase (ATP) [Candidatus Omnitrophota bacterium]